MSLNPYLYFNGQIPIAETFWALRFGKVVDRFDVPWLVNGEKAAVENAA